MDFKPEVMPVKVFLDVKEADKQDDILKGFNLDESVKNKWNEEFDSITNDICDTMLKKENSVGIPVTGAMAIEYIQSNWSQQQILLYASAFLRDAALHKVKQKLLEGDSPSVTVKKVDRGGFLDFLRSLGIDPDK